MSVAKVRCCGYQIGREDCWQMVPRGEFFCPGCWEAWDALYARRPVTCEHGEDPAGCELCARDERDVRRFEQEHDEGVQPS